MPAIAAAPVFYAAVAGGAATLGKAYMDSRSAKSATKAQVEAANNASAIEAKSAQDALDFAKEQEAARQREWQSAQDRNYGIYLQQRKDLEPYRRLGAGAIGQMARPIPRSGSLGQMIGGA